MTDKRLITPEDLYRMHWVNDPVVSPASGAIAYVHKSVSENSTVTVPISGCFLQKETRTFPSRPAKRMPHPLGPRTGRSLLSCAKGR